MGSRTSQLHHPLPKIPSVCLYLSVFDALVHDLAARPLWWKKKKKKKKVLLHGEFQDGKTLDVESIYQFTLVEELASGGNSPKIGAIADFVDSAAFAGIGGGE